MIGQNEMNERFKIKKEARLDEQKKIGKALVKFIDEHQNDLSFLGALKKIASDLSNGKFKDGEK
jgi:hypothetical protein